MKWPRHQRGPDDHGAALAKHAVGEIAAEHRGEIDQAAVESVDLRGQGLDVERAEQRLEAVPERGEPDHGAGHVGLERVFHHVEHKQCPHPVEGEALPHLGGEQVGERGRVAEEVGRRGGARRLGIAEGRLAHW
jgi:hypothetical protein